MEEKPNCHRQVHENCVVRLKPKDVLKDIVKSLNTMCINVSIRTIQCCLNRNRLSGIYHDEAFFTSHVILLFGLILPKRSWTKAINFGNKYYGVMKQKLSFLDNYAPKLNCTLERNWRYCTEDLA